MDDGKNTGSPFFPFYSTGCKFGCTNPPPSPPPHPPPRKRRKHYKTLHSSFLSAFLFARQRCFSIIQGGRVSIPSRATDLKSSIYSQQKQQICRTPLREHGFITSPCHIPWLCTQKELGILRLPSKNKLKKKEYRYIRCILKHPFQVAFSADRLLCNTSTYYVTASIQIKEIFT